MVGTHAKRQSPSRIPAQPAKDRRPDRGLTYPLNPNSCRKPSKTHLLGSHKIGTKSSRTDGWKHFQTVGLEKRKRRKQDSSPRGGQLWRQTESLFLGSGPLFLSKWPLDFLPPFFKNVFRCIFFWHDMALMTGYDNPRVVQFSPPATVLSPLFRVHCSVFFVHCSLF